MLIHSSVFNSAASWTVAHQAPLPMEFSREEYRSGVPLPSPGDLPNSGIEHRSLASPALTGGFFTTSATWEAPHKRVCVCMCSVTHSCLTLCNPMDCNPPSSSVHGILQARILDWAAISFSRRSSRPRDRTQVSCIAGGFFTVWATREAQRTLMNLAKYSMNIFCVKSAVLGRIRASKMIQT